MIVEQIYTSCLSQGSYYIESNNEVAIIDPIRSVFQRSILFSITKISGNTRIKK